MSKLGKGVKMEFETIKMVLLGIFLVVAVAYLVLMSATKPEDKSAEAKAALLLQAEAIQNLKSQVEELLRIEAKIKSVEEQVKAKNQDWQDLTTRLVDQTKVIESLDREVDQIQSDVIYLQRQGVVAAKAKDLNVRLHVVNGAMPFRLMKPKVSEGSKLRLEKMQKPKSGGGK